MPPRSRQKGLVLILARELASKLATSMFVVDPAGTLVFYNEPAEKVLGQPFAEAGEMPPWEWGALFLPQDPGGDPLPLEDLPLTIALRKKKPAHKSFHITGVDGVKRLIAVTAFPLFAHEGELVGALAIFWEERDDRAVG